MHTLKAFWPVEKKMFSLGNFLIFRQELELLAKIKRAKKAVIHFVSQNPKIDLPSYAKEAFTSELEFELFIKTEEHEPYDWPEKEKRYLPEINASLQNVARLSQISGFPPHLQWPMNTRKQAQNILKAWQGSNKQKSYSCHLKCLGTNREESNAEPENWYQFFKKYDKKASYLFILLGADPIPFDTSSFSSLVSAQKENIALSVQLALCELTQGFIGMASGISTAPIFSSIPYAIFKHPLHHTKEMQREIGEEDCFSFAKPGQKLLRTEDNFEALDQAFLSLNKNQ